MSVLIKGMLMPQCCGECQLMVDRWCYASEDCYYSPDRRHPDCPLVEVPTLHGRLIDADELVHKLGVSDEDIYVRDYLEDAPTVIESED